MSLLFWGLAVAMLVLGIGFAAHPFRSGSSILDRAGFVVALIFSLSSLGLYALLGSPDAMTAESSLSKTEAHTKLKTASGQSKRSNGSVASLVDGLRDRLENEPDDGGGWLLLAKSYQHLGRDAEAMDAYSRARALGKSDVNLEASLLGPSLAAPKNVVDKGPALRGRVTLSPDAALQVQPDDTVFIFAKESPEQRMPVVALRKRVSDLPLEFAMTDKEMMVPDTSLEDYPELVVTAKISRSGNASDNSQSLEAWSRPVSPLDNSQIELVIARKTQNGNNNNE